MKSADLKWSSLQSNRHVRRLIIGTGVIALGVAIGEFSVTYVVPIKPLLVGVVALLGVLFLLQNQTVKDVSLQKGLLHLTIIAGFLGSAFLAIPVGPIHIFPYRVLLPLLWLIFAMGILLQGRVDLSHIKVKPYLQFLAFWLLYAILSLVWAVAKTDAIRDIIFLFMAVSVIFFVVYYFSNGKDLKRSYYLWSLVLAALLPIGLWENLTGNHLSVSGLIGAPRANMHLCSRCRASYPRS